jgi:hypothetical protein
MMTQNVSRITILFFSASQKLCGKQQLEVNT